MRERVKQVLGRLSRGPLAPGLTALIYHRVGGGSSDERDVSTARFAQQVEHLAGLPVIALDVAVARLQAGDASPSVVLTFDDGFRDVHENAWPLLRAVGLPFTVYLASGFVGGTMRWEGSTAKDARAPALSWRQLAEMVDTGLCTIGNHTHDHVRPEALDDVQLDRCSEVVEQHLGVRPRHFAYPWGVPVPRMEPALGARFTTSATGHLGRAVPGDDLLRLPRIPVRGSDPPAFFAAKLRTGLLPERAYARLVATGKALGARA